MIPILYSIITIAKYLIMTSAKTQMVEEVKGLDDETTYIYIKHKNSSKVFELPTTAAIHSKLLKVVVFDDNNTTTQEDPFVIELFDDQCIQLMVDYLMFHDNKIESASPDKPLSNIHISVILGKEYVLFADVVESKMDLLDKIIKIGNIINCSLYFNTTHLTGKLCAIVASLIKDKSIEELKLLQR
jgi:hypothetical protein